MEDQGQDITPPPTMQDDAIAPTYFVIRKDDTAAALVATDELPGELELFGDVGPVADIHKTGERIKAKMICLGENLDVPNRKYKFGKERCPTCGRRESSPNKGEPPSDEKGHQPGEAQEGERKGKGKGETLQRLSTTGSRRERALSKRSNSPGRYELPSRDRSPLPRHAATSDSSSTSKQDSLGRGERMRKETLRRVPEEEADRETEDSDSNRVQVD